MSSQSKVDTLSFIKMMPSRSVAKALVSIAARKAELSIDDVDIRAQVVAELKEPNVVDQIENIIKEDGIESAISEVGEIDIDEIIEAVKQS